MAKKKITDKDWTGNANSIYKTLGASSHTDEVRQREDFYATHPDAAKWLLKLETFNDDIWEPACGEGHLSEVFKAAGYNVRSSDLFDRQYGDTGVDFLGIDNFEWHGDIITNPPYIYAQEFIEKALMIVPEGRKVAMFLKIQFMESKGRKHLFTNFPPKKIYVSSSRLLCAKNGDFSAYSKKKNSSGGGAVAYCWYVWEKGFNGDTVIKWFN